MPGNPDTLAAKRIYDHAQFLLNWLKIKDRLEGRKASRYRNRQRDLVEWI
jgi:hypothetical protein